MFSPKFVNDNEIFCWRNPVFLVFQCYEPGNGYVENRRVIHRASWATNNLKNGSLFLSLFTVKGSKLSVRAPQ